MTPNSFIPAALPFWMSLGIVPLAVLSMAWGGFWWLMIPFYAWYLVTALDKALGRNEANGPTDAPDTALFWHRAITIIWPPIQLCLILAALWAASLPDHLSLLEKIGLFTGIGIASGTVGIVYAHELLHQRNPFERWLGDLLLACVLYSHFRSEHLLVHHSWVATPRDAVSARMGEGFYRFFIRVLREGLSSAWRAETRLLARGGRKPASLRNPFWRYAALQGAMVILAVLIGGWTGVALFIWQAFIAVWQLELTNYVEHYGLTRKYLGEGRYEHIKPRHSWNASHRATNWLLINLQRHSDHHVKPDRRFPLLQTYSEDEAPQLPFGYPAMTMIAMVPPLWRKRMNPRVRAWRRRFYPEVEDWTAYNRGSNPMPRRAL